MRFRGDMFSVLLFFLNCSSSSFLLCIAMGEKMGMDPLCVAGRVRGVTERERERQRERTGYGCLVVVVIKLEFDFSWLLGVCVEKGGGFCLPFSVSMLDTAPPLEEGAGC